MKNFRSHGPAYVLGCLLATVALVTAAPAGAQVAVDFERLDLAAGHTPTDLVASDLDGDGAPELLSASETSGRVTLWRNLGGGTFAPGLDVIAVAGPHALAVGHFDADATPDVAVLSATTGAVHVYFGAGDGTFTAAGSVPIQGELLSLAAADLTGDGFDELLVGERTTDSLYVAENAGDGTFLAVTAHATYGGAGNIAVGDLNGDGDPDVATSIFDYGDWGSVLLGGPGLTFLAPIYFPSSYGGESVWVDLADMDGDGLLDLITSEDDGFDRDTIVWPGLGDGSFGEELWYSLSYAWPSLQTIGDFNGDGLPDVAVRNQQEDVRTLLNPGTGVLLENELAETAAGVVALAVADLDGDGNDDVVTANGTNPSLTVLLARPAEVTAWGTKLLLQYSLPQLHQLALKKPELAGQVYWVLGSASGSTPGLTVDGVVIPLNVDGYTQFTLSAPNTWVQGSLGLLDPTGAAHAEIEVLGPTLSPSLAGVKLRHAFLVLDSSSGTLVYASEALAVRFV